MKQVKNKLIVDNFKLIFKIYIIKNVLRYILIKCGCI